MKNPSLGFGESSTEKANRVRRG